jgi:hypothetical protein
MGRLADQDRTLPDPAFDYRLGEALGAVASVLARGQSLPPRPTLTSRGAYHDSDRTGRFRAHLRHLFSCSPKRPALLIAACDAAERVGTPEDLQLLDEQTRHLDVQAGFTILQTDRILQTRDRVLVVAGSFCRGDDHTVGEGGGDVPLLPDRAAGGDGREEDGGSAGGRRPRGGGGGAAGSGSADASAGESGVRWDNSLSGDQAMVMMGLVRQPGRSR